jgi:hypothetical protein
VGAGPSGSMNREVKHGKRSPSDAQSLERPLRQRTDQCFGWDSAAIVSATAFPLVRPYAVGATGFEPVTSSVSANNGEPLCYTSFPQVASNRRRRS